MTKTRHNLPVPFNFEQQPLLIEHSVGIEVVTQRPIDGYVNATELCQQAGKLFGNYYKSATGHPGRTPITTGDLGASQGSYPPRAMDFACLCSTGHRVGVRLDDGQDRCDRLHARPCSALPEEQGQDPSHPFLHAERDLPERNK